MKALNIKTTQLPIVFGVIAVLVMAIAVTVTAEDSELDSNPRVLPYNGVLEFNGEMYEGEVDLKFTLTDESGAGGGDCEFVEEHHSVMVYNGRFTTNVGVHSGGVGDCLFDAEQILLQLGVRSADSGGGAGGEESYKTLSGYQRVHPSFAAYWSAEGSDFKVDGDANINGTANITGDNNVNGNVNIGGNTNIIGNLGVDTNVSVDGDLSLVGALSNPNADVAINDNLAVTGNTNIRNDTEIGGSLSVYGDAGPLDPLFTLFVEGNTYLENQLTVGKNLRLGSTPASPFTAQLSIANNTAEPGNIDEFSDYQLLLHNSNNPATSLGLGVQGGEMFLNGTTNVRGNFIVNAHANVVQTLNVGSHLTVSGRLLSSSNQSVTSNGGFDAWGGSIRSMGDAGNNGDVYASRDVTAERHVVAHGNMTTTNIVATGDSVFHNLRVNRSFKLPVRTNPPYLCNNDNIGSMYMDSDSDDHMVPCVCMKLPDHSPKWAPTDNWNALCN